METTGSKGMIRVLVVDDSLLMCKILTDRLNSDPQIIVVGTAQNGKEAVDMVPCLKPDIITMDIDMPVMNGFEATRQITADHPTPILIISASVFTTGTDRVFQAISFGALDVLDKNQIENVADENSRDELIGKIKLLSGIKVVRQPMGTRDREGSSARTAMISEGRMPGRIIAIVASTGGPQAILKILKILPDRFPCGIVIVQHIASGFLDGLVEWFGRECRIQVKKADHLEEIRPGVVYIAPSEFQMRVTEGGRIGLSDEPSRDGFKPSGNVLLESVAEVYGEGAVGVILTGMGKDGAAGIKKIQEMKGRTIAEDEKSCIIFGMPKAAIDLNAVDKVLPLEIIAEEIVKMLAPQ